MSSLRPSLTVGEVARQFGVAPATVQRWVDTGKLAAARTPGGHRRIPVAEVRRLAAAIQPLNPRSRVSRWLDTLFTGETHRVKAALLSARQSAGDWGRVADDVASALTQIGKRWEVGLCKVFEEHCATEALRRAAAICVEDMPRPVVAPLAALFAVEEERHILGLSLAELVLAEAGWRVLWLGEGPPREEISRLVSLRSPDALVVSASVVSKPRTVRAYQKMLAEVARKTGPRVVLGGAGAWQPSPWANRAVTFEELRRLALRLRRQGTTHARA